MLSADDIDFLKEQFKDLKGEVTLTLFTSKDCELCKEDEELLRDIVSVSPKLKLDVTDIEKDPQKAKIMGIEKAPAIVFTGDKTYPIYYIGSPIGYETSALVADIISISTRESSLPNSIKEELKKINQVVEIKVFVTPSCPYCPGMVHTAHLFSLENSKIITKMVECAEFDDECTKYNVEAVPKVVINDKVEYEGATPPAYLLERIKEALSN